MNDRMEIVVKKPYAIKVSLAKKKKKEKKELFVCTDLISSNFHIIS